MIDHPAHARPTRAPRAALALLFAAFALDAAACGGAAPAKAPAYEQRDKFAEDEGLAEPRTIEEAQQQIAQARASLEGDADAKATAGSSTPSRESPATSPQGGAAPSARHERSADVCGGPCRALASMKRAVEALCRMTGETDDRCAEAKRTLGESTSRIAYCRCEGS